MGMWRYVNLCSDIKLNTRVFMVVTDQHLLKKEYQYFMSLTDYKCSTIYALFFLEEQFVPFQVPNIPQSLTD